MLILALLMPLFSCPWTRVAQYTPSRPFSSRSMCLAIDIKLLPVWPYIMSKSKVFGVVWLADVEKSGGAAQMQHLIETNQIFSAAVLQHMGTHLPTLHLGFYPSEADLFHSPKVVTSETGFLIIFS